MNIICWLCDENRTYPFLFIFLTEIKRRKVPTQSYCIRAKRGESRRLPNSITRIYQLHRYIDSQITGQNQNKERIHRWVNKFENQKYSATRQILGPFVQKHVFPMKLRHGPERCEPRLERNFTFPVVLNAKRFAGMIPLLLPLPPRVPVLVPDPTNSLRLFPWLSFLIKLSIGCSDGQSWKLPTSH